MSITSQTQELKLSFCGTNWAILGTFSRPIYDKHCFGLIERKTNTFWLFLFVCTKTCILIGENYSPEFTNLFFQDQVTALQLILLLFLHNVWCTIQSRKFCIWTLSIQTRRFLCPSFQIERNLFNMCAV